MDSQELFIKTLINASFSLAIKETYNEFKSIIKNYSNKVTLITTEKDLENNLIAEIRKTSNWA